MKPFNFTQYIKNNPLLKENINEAEAMPAEAQKLVSDTEQALESKSEIDFMIEDVALDRANVTLLIPSRPGGFYITLTVDLELIDTDVVKVNPDRILIDYSKDEQPYEAKDTTKIVQILNDKHPNKIEAINDAWLEAENY
jgi:hypothetical protein